MTNRHLAFAIPGDPEQRTGGYIYDRRLAAELTHRGWRLQLIRLPDRFPFPEREDLAAAAAALDALPDGARTLIDGLAFSAMPDLIASQAGRLALTALIHHPLGYETGLSSEQAARLIADERRALAHAPRVIVTSDATLDTLVQDFGVPAQRVTVALPGTDEAPLARGSGDGHRLHLLAVGSVIPRKAFPDLVEALARLKDLPWRLTIVGSLERAPDEAQRLRAGIERHGLSHRIVLEGELAGEALARAYDRADLLVSVSRYEGFGMALAEGLARGLPMLAVAGGAVGRWLDPNAAMLVPPERPDRLASALRTVMTDSALRERLRAGALQARDILPSWADTAAAAERALLDGAEP